MVNVKILLASYNGEKYIEEQIETILKQENVKIDLLIQDDNSTDRTVDVIKDRFPNLNVRINIPGTGKAAKNFLKLLCSLNFDENFEYVAFADQDDIWLPNKIYKAISLLEKNKASLYCSNLTKWDSATNTKSLLKKSFPQQQYDFLFEGGSAGCTYVFTKKLALDIKLSLEKNARFIKDKSFSHDWFVYFLARSKNLNVIIDENSYIDYRLHDSNVHGHLNKLSWNTIKVKSTLVLQGYYENSARFFLPFLEKDSKAYLIYDNFLSGYFLRNYIIWRYNKQLMRDRKKFILFALINLIKFK